MAIVLQGYDEKLGRDVAIKVLAPKLADQEVSRERFAREARLTAKLRSDRVLTVYSVNDEHELPYIVMELIDGGTLRERLKANGPLADSDLRQLCVDLADGLEVAHQQGLLHRDLKPSNIAYRSTDGRAVIMDFGLARVVCDSDPLTEQGFSPGTPAFMSPEQVKGGSLTRQSDLFSLGTVLYVAATGESPFRGADTSTTCDAVVKCEFHDVSSLRTDLPGDIAHVIRKLMTSDISHRYASAAQVLTDLAVKPPSSGSGWKPVATACAGLAAGAIILAAIILQIRRTDGSTEEISLEGVERIVIVPKDGKLHVEAAKAETADLKDAKSSCTKPRTAPSRLPIPARNTIG
jgi:serine/threonine protein kinase